MRASFVPYYDIQDTQFHFPQELCAVIARVSLYLSSMWHTSNHADVALAHIVWYVLSQSGPESFSTNAFEVGPKG